MDLTIIFSALGVVATAVTGGWAAWPAYQQHRTELVQRRWRFTPDIVVLSQANTQKKLRIGVTLDGAALQRAVLEKADLWGADLQKAHLMGANLQGVLNLTDTQRKAAMT